MVFGGGVFRRQLFHKNRALMNEISALTRRFMREMLNIYKPAKGSSPVNQFTSTLTLDFPVSPAVRDTVLLFKPPSLWYSALGAGMP